MAIDYDFKELDLLLADLESIEATGRTEVDRLRDRVNRAAWTLDAVPQNCRQVDHAWHLTDVIARTQAYLAWDARARQTLIRRSRRLRSMRWKLRWVAVLTVIARVRRGVRRVVRR